MIWRATLLISSLTALLFISPHNVYSQDINSFKAGVVRIRNARFDEVGTGFIVKVDGNQLYIITAAHVVRGNQHPSVYLFNQQRDALQAELLDREDDDTKGLALLRLKVSSALVTGIRALHLSYTSQLGGGEDVKVIGFPDGTAFWTVDRGSIARIEGRNLVFSGSIRGGNSGGPVILNGSVVGVVTDVTQAAAYAARGEVIEPYVNGIVPNLITLGNPKTVPTSDPTSTPTATPTPSPTPIRNNSEDKYTVKVEGVEYKLVEAYFSGDTLFFYIIAVNAQATKRIALYHSTSLIDATGTSRKSAYRTNSDGSSKGTFDYFNVNLPYNVPVKFGVAFKTVPPNTDRVPYLKIVLFNAEDVEIRDIRIPYKRME